MISEEVIHRNGRFFLTRNWPFLPDSEWPFSPDPNTGPVPEKKTDVPFIVRVRIDDLNIRTGPGTSYPRTGIYTGIGSFTIVAVSTVNGVEWGKLKSGAGWICLGYTERV